ncbi:hypothetical protein AXG93_1660s1660 [Marchantia polymorpha subsp. ruderalis]|uniref:Uncharacterized protein n=1 Tax=Marchantia polymorpha subsp. ruderalis TaxID=1480154 RepID=A0A176VU56_MARPO|nr:hypothetical protein AXG93_1660s1660 [Marchantia polymorpha subsp. ruderalis]
MVSTKNKNLVDVHPPEQGPPLSTEDLGYQRVMFDKQKFKEKEKKRLKRMQIIEGEDLRSQNQAVHEDDRSIVPSGVKSKKKVDTSDNKEASSREETSAAAFGRSQVVTVEGEVELGSAAAGCLRHTHGERWGELGGGSLSPFGESKRGEVGLVAERFT